MEELEGCGCLFELLFSWMDKGDPAWWARVEFRDRVAGRLQSPRVSRNPSPGSIEFQLQGFPAELRFQSETGWATVETRRESTSGEFHLHRKGIYSGMDGVPKGAGVRTGFDLFDRDFVIGADSERLVRTLFAVDRRESFTRVVHRLARLGSPEIVASGDRLVVRVRTGVEDEARLRKLVHLAGKVLGHLRAAERRMGLDPGGESDRRSS